MSLFDTIAGQATAALGGNQDSGVIGELSKLISGNGLAGLLSQFQSKGLGDTVASWVGTGSNLPISKEQIGAVLGNDQVASIAKSLGISPADASNALAGALPQVVDKLTPDGKLPSDDLLRQGLSMLKMLGK